MEDLICDSQFCPRDSSKVTSCFSMIVIPNFSQTVEFLQHLQTDLHKNGHQEAPKESKEPKVRAFES